MQIVVYYKLFSKELTLEIIGSHEPHSMISFNGLYFSILLDPLSSLGKKLQGILEKKGKRNWIKFKVKNLINFDSLSDTTTLWEIKRISNIILSYLVDDHIIDTSYDIRIIKVLKYIQSKESLNLSASEVYNFAGLSESHFNLLFKNSVGIPLRKYILWIKLYRSVRGILTGSSFTDAAHLGDFTDSSHLARTFKFNTGLNLTKFFRNKRFVQVQVENLS